MVAASARKGRVFLIGLSDNGRSLLLMLIANVLAIIRPCSQLAEAAQHCPSTAKKWVESIRCVSVQCSKLVR